MAEFSVFEQLRRRVEQLCRAADDHRSSGRLGAAMLGYKQAFDLLPKPKQNWRWTLDILIGMVDVHLLKHDYGGARTAMSALLECPAAANNAQVHLRHGKLLFEMGDLANARSEFLRAFCQSGRSLFQREDDKYWDWLWQD